MSPELWNAAGSPQHPCTHSSPRITVESLETLPGASSIPAGRKIVSDLSTVVPPLHA